MGKQYIEITGESEYEQKIKTFIVRFEITVRAAKDSSALREAGELREKVLTLMIENGLEPKDIVEGGIEKWRPWSKRNKPGSYVHVRLILRAPEVDILAKAIAATTDEFANDRYSFRSIMQRPDFEDIEAAKLEAVRSAVADARTKAGVVAEEMGLKLGGLIRSSELDAQALRSGAYGDDSWWDIGGFGVTVGAAGGFDEEQPIEIEKPQRVIKIGYLCRFAIS